MSKIFLNAALGNPPICMVCCHTPEYAEIAKRTIYENKGEYARRWNHDLVVLTDVNPDYSCPEGHVGGMTWDRLREAVRLAKTTDYDWIYIVGGDTLITNMTISLTSLIDDAYHFIIANDCNEWNADSFLFRCSIAGIDFMEDVLAQFDRLKNHCWVEQQAMIEVRDKHPGIWKVLPQRAMNSYNYDLYPNKGGRDGKDCVGNDGQWQPGDFLIHWAGLPPHVRMEQIEKVWPQIVR